jgi:hypothetical protein
VSMVLVLISALANSRPNESTLREMTLSLVLRYLPCYIEAPMHLLVAPASRASDTRA